MKHLTMYLVVVGLAMGLSQILIADDTLSWSGNFSNINIATPISTQAMSVTASETITLQTTGDAVLTADNSNSAQLSCATDTLKTEYRLVYDGDGASDTGGTDVDWVIYSSFISSGSNITHVGVDDFVDVTLWIRASNYANDMADADTYNATQTITAIWAGP